MRFEWKRLNSFSMTKTKEKHKWKKRKSIKIHINYKKLYENRIHRCGAMPLSHPAPTPQIHHFSSIVRQLKSIFHWLIIYSYIFVSNESFSSSSIQDICSSIWKEWEANNDKSQERHTHTNVRTNTQTYLFSVEWKNKKNKNPLNKPANLPKKKPNVNERNGTI